MKGGTATLTFANTEKLEGPDISASLDVPAGHCKTYRFTYRGNLPSGEEDDVIVRGEFTENDAESGSVPLEAETKLTCVQVELEAVYEVPCTNAIPPTGYFVIDLDPALYDDDNSRPLLIGGREDAYTQTFKIESDGTSSIRKFGYKLERNRWLPFGFVSQTGEN